VRLLWRSPTIQSAIVIGVSGVGFALANLLLARVLPTADYALFTLVVALINFSHALAPAGIDGIVNRRRLEAGPALLRRTIFACTLVALAFVALGWLGYGLSASVLMVLLLSTIAGGAMMVAGAQFQSEQRYTISLALIQSPNLVLILAGLVVLIMGVWHAWLPLFIYMVGFITAAVYGWVILLRERSDKPFRDTWFPWGEALAFAGVSAAGLLLIQLERLVIPHVLTDHDLATFGVLAVIAGSLFRVLQMGVGYALVPRLRAATSVIERRRLIAREAKLVAAIIAVGSVAIWFVTPLIERWFLAGKYHLGGALLIAALVTGVAKVLNAFTKSTLTALATPSELTVVNILGWVSALVAIVAAVIGARWGLVGVIYGVGLGWLVRALTALYFTTRHLRIAAPVPVTVP
jgi:O-antigen/teichoic acid export membrane protein